MLNKIVIIEKIDKNSFDNLELYLNSINDDPLNNYIQKGCERVCPLSGNNLKQIFGIYVNKYHANIYSFFKNSELKDEIKMSNIFTEIMYAGQTIGFYEPNKNIFYKFDNAPKVESDSRMIAVINEVIK